MRLRVIAMSTASRQPYQSSVPASWPKLVDRSTGAIDRAALRAELRSRWQGPCAWPFSRTLAVTFQKVRLQRRWALEDIEETKAIRERIAAERAALEQQARQIAERCGFDAGHIRFQRDRYSFGSLAENYEAPQMRRLYARALDIALEHHDAPVLALAAAE